MSEKLQAQITIIKTGLKSIVSELERIDEAYKQMPIEAKADLELSLEQLGKLPFKPCKEGSKAGWIFADIEGAEKLRALIKESESGKVPLHGYEYSISKGETREFISRRPI